MTGSYFAQARYYDSNAGRFVSEDKVRGFADKPDTINHYLYCLNMPLIAIDLDGNILNLVIGAVVGGVVNGGLEIIDAKLNGEEIDWKKVGLSTVQGAIEGTAIATGCVGAAMVVQFATDIVFNTAKDYLDGNLTAGELAGNVVGAGVNALAVGGVMKGASILADKAPKIANKLFSSGKHPVLEKIASEFIAQGELVNNVNGIKEIGKGLGKNCLDSLAKYAFSGAPDAMEAAKIVGIYALQENVIDFMYNRITGWLGKGIDYACEKIIDLANSLVAKSTVVNQSQCAA